MSSSRRGEDPTSVTVVTIFEVSGEAVDQVIALQDDCEAFVSSQDGFISATFLRSQTGADTFNLVSVSEWESRPSFKAAFTHPQLAELAAGHPQFDFHRGFYDVIRSV